MMNEQLFNIALEIAFGAGMWTLALLFPFRRLQPNVEWKWDLMAVLAAFCFALIVTAGYSRFLDATGAFGDTWSQFVAGWSLPMQTLGFIVFADLSSYWAHRLLHTRLLWHGHAFHHSSKHLYVLAGLRGSIVHVAALFAGPIVALYLFPLYETPLVLMLITMSQVANQHYTHSNIRVPLSRYIEYVFVTPRFHFVHHSVDRGLSNSNFGFLFTVWDRLFGTFSDPECVAPDEPLGLDYDNSKWRLLLGIAPRQ